MIYFKVLVSAVLMVLIFFITANSSQAASFFKYIFMMPGTLYESASPDTSTSPYWWVNSGGLLDLKDGRGLTMQGKLETFSPWRLLYAASNPVDTDDGYHPQNIFRLVSRDSWENSSQEVYFKIIASNHSDSPNRNASNGLLLFDRYQDSDNLYYAGVRVDGTAVIKKKKDGRYYTLAQKKVFTGLYDSVSNHNLLPINRWIGVRSVVVTDSDGSVSLDLYMDMNWNEDWVLTLSARDDNQSYGGTAIHGAGHGGLRTDFMDVMFDNYRLQSL